MAKQLTLLETIFLANEFGVEVTFRPQSPVQTILTLKVVSDVAGLADGSVIDTMMQVTAMDQFKEPQIADIATAAHITEGLRKLRAITGAEG